MHIYKPVKFSNCRAIFYNPSGTACVHMTQRQWQQCVSSLRLKPELTIVRTCRPRVLRAVYHTNIASQSCADK